MAQLLFCIFLVILLFPQKTFANENFVIKNDATYTIQDDGTTKVAFNISLSNTSSQYYASMYKIRVGFTNIFAVTAKDPDGEIIPTVTKDEKGHEIAVVFNKRVVGVNNTLPFTLTFETPDIAQKMGSIWDVNIPGLAAQDEFDSFNVQVKVPSSFGQPTYIKPRVGTGLSFTKEQLGSSGLSLAFGEAQVYTFSLSYHIKNPHVFPIKTEIALPPETNYQQVIIDSIEPKPSNVLIDSDGNWLAEYHLLPSQKMDVLVKGKTLLSLTPKTSFLSDEEKILYTKPQKYWEQTPEIIELAKKLKSPRAIYDYVVKTLSYDFGRVTDRKPRVGAPDLLKNPTSAVCLEFTDLFIAIARASGIPAREIDGFATTENTKERPLSLLKDVLHAWPEYYDAERNTWIMVDPTWGNTTRGIDYFDVFDFDHLAFVIKGKSSTYPIPAGEYKYSRDQNAKDVTVGFSDPAFNVKREIMLNTSFPTKKSSVFPIQGTVTVKNSGNALYEESLILISSDVLTPKSRTFSLPKIPPFGNVTIPVNFDKANLLTNKEATITMKAREYSLTHVVRVIPFYKALFTEQKAIVIGGVFIVVFTLIIWFVTKRARRIPVP